VEPRIPVVAPRIDARRPLTQPPYPAADVRAGNEGNGDLEVYVLPNGRVGDARIVRSTGFERLDRSAIEEAKRNWRLVPGTRNGQPEAQWYRVRVTFRITNQ
jgi:protein TonB